VVNGVLAKGSGFDDGLVAAQSLADPRDRALAHKMAATVLRRYGQLSQVVDSFTQSPLRPGPARWILVLGAAQLLFMRVPDHAAVDSAIRLMEARRAGALSGLVNAVLRRVAREREAILAAMPAAEVNLPPWLRQSWSSAYGVPVMQAMAEALTADPPLDLTLRNPAGADRVVEDLESAGHNTTRIGQCTVRLTDSTPVAGLPGYAAGHWWVQDAAAALPARLLPVRPGDAVIDLCAAPGGKTAQLAAAGALVTAVDRNPDRLSVLLTNLQRLDLSADLVEADACVWKPDRSASAVLLDAPCTATGTARRNPDVIHLKREGDTAALVALQDRLLDNAAAMTASGGTLLFSTCSLQLEEGPHRVDRFLADHPEFRRDRIRPDEVGADFAAGIDENGDLRTLPTFCAPGGADGFFVARLRRNSGKTRAKSDPNG